MVGRPALARLKARIRSATADGSPALSWLWLLAAALLLVFPLRLWTSPQGRSLLHLPTTPVDVSDPELAAAWRFLEAAAGHVPTGATYTCRADDPVLEMNLHMVSLGLLAHADARPSSYYGRPTPAGGSHASYLLVMGQPTAAEAALDEVTRVAGGVVLRHPEDGP
jgi:hypothetical protein